MTIPHFAVGTYKVAVGMQAQPTQTQPRPNQA
jgi:hypothetical protein